MAKKAELEQYIRELELDNTRLKNELRELKEYKKNERGAGRKKIITEEVELEVQRLYSFGTRMETIAKRFNLSLGSVHKIIHAD